MPNALFVSFPPYTFFGGVGWVNILDIFRVDRFSIDDDIGPTVSTKQAARDLIDATHQHEDTRFIFLPKVVVWDCVGKLNLPRNEAPRLDLSRLPQPSPNDILTQQGLVDCALIFDYFL